MTDLPVADPIAEQLHAVDWSLDVPADAAGLMVGALRARRSRRRVTAVAAVTCVGVVGGLALVLGLPSTSHGYEPTISDFSHLPPITRARAHRAGWDVAPATSTGRLTGQQSLNRACNGRSWVACGEPNAYLLDVKDSDPDGDQPQFRTEWLIAWPPRWRPMISCGGPLEAPKSGLCEYYGVAFEPVDANTGRLGDYIAIAVSSKHAPPPPSHSAHG